MRNYEVTLAMPVYNVERYVERSLLSALDQTFQSIEFLIVDDKGPDNSMDVVRKVKASHPRGQHIRIIEHEKNIGTGGTKNTAIREAAGQYLFFMDSDDTIIPQTIELLYNRIKETDADVVLSSCQDIKNDEVTQTYVYPDLVVEGEFAINEWMEKTKILYEVPTWNKLYKISMLRDNNITCVPHHRNEDTVFTFKTLFCVKKVSSISTITYNYYLNDNSTVRQKLSDFYYKQYLEIFEERKKVMQSSEIEVPQIFKYYFMEPFVTSFIPKVLNSDFPYSKKKSFISTISEMKSIGYTSSLLEPSDFSLLYKLISGKHTFMLIYYYKIRTLLANLHIIR